MNFHIQKEDALGLVGESGCGKTTTGRLILHLEALTHGTIAFNGKDITHPDKNEKHSLKKEMQIIFQDPFESLNPRMTAEELIGQPLIIHKMTVGKAEYLGTDPFQANHYLCRYLSYRSKGR